MKKNCNMIATILLRSEEKYVRMYGREQKKVNVP